MTLMVTVAVAVSARVPPSLLRAATLIMLVVVSLILWSLPLRRCLQPMGSVPATAPIARARARAGAQAQAVCLALKLMPASMVMLLVWWRGWSRGWTGCVAWWERRMGSRRWGSCRN